MRGYFKFCCYFVSFDQRSDYVYFCLQDVFLRCSIKYDWCLLVIVYYFIYYGDLLYMIWVCVLSFYIFQLI